MHRDCDISWVSSLISIHNLFYVFAFLFLKLLSDTDTVFETFSFERKTNAS